MFWTLLDIALLLLVAKGPQGISSFRVPNMLNATVVYVL